jgi:excisionase family DNA binding protein
LRESLLIADSRQRAINQGGAIVRLASIAARRTSMSYTLAEAAAACGLDKSTVRRAVRSGRISGTRDEGGVWHVEPVELHRVFPPAAQRTVSDTTAAPRDAPAAAALKSERDAATDALVAELRGVITDLRHDRDHWREQAQRLALPAPAPIAEARQSWWRRLRMTG